MEAIEGGAGGFQTGDLVMSSCRQWLGMVIRADLYGLTILWNDNQPGFISWDPNVANSVVGLNRVYLMRNCYVNDFMDRSPQDFWLCVGKRLDLDQFPKPVPRPDMRAFINDLR
jgi:hypothetical protein